MLVEVPDLGPDLRRVEVAAPQGVEAGEQAGVGGGSDVEVFALGEQGVEGRSDPAASSYTR